MQINLKSMPLYSILFIVILFSCNSDDDSSTPDNSDGCFEVTTIVIDDVVYKNPPIEIEADYGPNNDSDYLYLKSSSDYTFTSGEYIEFVRIQAPAEGTWTTDYSETTALLEIDDELFGAEEGQSLSIEIDASGNITGCFDGTFIHSDQTLPSKKVSITLKGKLN